MSAPLRGLALASLLTSALWGTGCSDEAPDQSPAATQAAADRSPAAETAAESDEGAAAPESPELMRAGESNLSTDLAVTYRGKCAPARDPSLECEILRSLLIADVVMALEEIEQARDQRGTEEALAALDIDDEPEIQIAAMRILGQFPDTPGIAGKALPLLLDSQWLAVQDMAADLLSRNPDPKYKALGSLWSGSHSGLYAEDAYETYPDFASSYSDLGFPEYPYAEWFSPGDSDRSVGWWTDDDPAEVTKWLNDELDVEPLSYQQWAERISAQSMAVFQSIDPAKQAELERLMAEYMKTQNMALVERMQKLQEEMSAPMEDARKTSEMGVDAIALPSIADIFETARYFVAEERDGHVARLIIMYPLPGLERTVIQEAWNLLDYPSAWPAAEAQEQ